MTFTALHVALAFVFGYAFAIMCVWPLLKNRK